MRLFTNQSKTAIASPMASIEVAKGVRSPNGFMKPCALDDDQTLHQITEEEFFRLVDGRLVRLETYRGMKRVELTHDLLAPVIREHRDQQRETERQRKAEEERAKLRRRNRLLAFGIAAVSIAFIVMSALALWAVAQKRLAVSRELAASALAQLSSDPELSTLLALEAAYALGKRSVPEVENALHQSVQASRIQLTLTGHTSPVYGLAFSPDGQRIATASWDRTAKVWDAASGKELLTLTGHTSPVYGLVFSPDGQRIATASGDRVEVYAYDMELLVALAKTRISRSLKPEERRKYLNE